MAQITRAGTLTHVEPLQGDEFLSYVNAVIRCSDREDDGSGDGAGGETDYVVTVFGNSAATLMRLAEANRHARLVFSGRYAVRHLSVSPWSQHEVIAEYIGLDLDGLTPDVA